MTQGNDSTQANDSGKSEGRGNGSSAARALQSRRKLRLGPLPRTDSTKVTFACPASLKADLDRYAALHGQTYGEAVDAAALIPYMLEAFIAGDRGFRKKG
ncbi:hypothetical protein NB688_002548 [Xanthomonas sacchari]|uniref:DUF2274 domain-containing protein n=1 Tax=Xanthomonas sacchari TaxID=56458 RepID=A0ABT3DUF8_9XANT|nr:hypothetical protein [Xanthomonas sacchari]MCW0420382.1 hypothetical protein [Xanthomonas sacchari]